MAEKINVVKVERDTTAEDKSCWKCKHKRTIPGNCHIRCANPDPNMTGNSYGIKEGWFFYPACFDPTWMTKECSNYAAMT